MQLNTYLQFNGQCEAAFAFYEKCLGGKTLIKMIYGESPMAEQTPVAWRGKIMHARLSVLDQVLMGSDSPPEQYNAPKGVSLCIGLSNAAEAERVYAALSENGTIVMPLQPTFWAERFGMFTDQFGIAWMINCEKATAS